MSIRSASALHWQAFISLTTKEIKRFCSIFSLTLLAPVVTLTLYLIVFGELFGRNMQPINGYAYIQYLLPGIVLMAIIQNAYANTATSLFIAKFNNSVEEILIAPIANSIIILAYTIGGAVRGLIVGLIVLGIGALLTNIPIQHPLLALSIAALAAAIFAVAGLINAIYAKSFDDISMIPTFIITPLTYLGGVFYSIHSLPQQWQTLSLCNPVLVIVDSFRYALLGISDTSITYASIAMIGLLILLLLWAYWLLYYGIGLKQ